MISINGMNLCSHCFRNMSGGVCRNCSGTYNRDKFPQALTEGEVLAGKYIVGRVLGKGGFGITYLCYDIIHNCRVAVKEYLPDGYSFRNSGQKTVNVTSSENEKIYKAGAEKFYREAKLLSQFSGNEAVVSVKEFFRENNTVYFVMEYLSGADLKYYLKVKGRMSEAQIMSIAVKVLSSLRSLHSRKLLHRDISPDNIFICNDGRVKLIDFGAARMAMGGAMQSFSVILKPEFAPLEQYKSNGHQGPWTDVYALGATMYYALKLRTAPDAISRLNNDYIDMSGISPQLASIIAKMMALRIEDRYQNADAPLNELQRVRGFVAPAKSVTSGGGGYNNSPYSNVQYNNGQYMPQQNIPYAASGQSHNGGGLGPVYKVLIIVGAVTLTIISMVSVALILGSGQI